MLRVIRWTRFVLTAGIALVLASCGSAVKITSTSFAPLEPNNIPEIKRILVVSGTTNETATTRRLCDQLIAALVEQGFEAIPGDSIGWASAKIAEPFSLSTDSLSYTTREWKECASCTQRTGAREFDAVWVLWARWIKSDPQSGHEEYFEGEPGWFRLKTSSPWLQASALLFEPRRGELLAWTARRRTGIGFLFYSWGPAYSSIAGAMAKDLRKSQAGRT